MQSVYHLPSTYKFQSSFLKTQGGAWINRKCMQTKFCCHLLQKNLGNSVMRANLIHCRDNSTLSVLVTARPAEVALSSAQGRILQEVHASSCRQHIALTTGGAAPPTAPALRASSLLHARSLPLTRPDTDLIALRNRSATPSVVLTTQHYCDCVTQCNTPN